MQPIKDIIDALVEAGADVTCVDIFGSTPLHYATTHGNLEAVITLLKSKDIDINVGEFRFYDDYCKHSLTIYYIL